MNQISRLATTVLVSGGLGLAGVGLGAGIAHANEGPYQWCPGDVPLIERVGHYPSPTVLVDDVDVMRPEADVPIGDACRLDLPTPQRVLHALRPHSPDQAQTPSQPTEF